MESVLQEEMNKKLGKIGTVFFFCFYFKGDTLPLGESDYDTMLLRKLRSWAGNYALSNYLWSSDKLYKLLMKIQTYVILLPQPPTAKMHAIIERTANFVCKQGAQFEIMLKAKQARNSQFDFLRFDHYLNPYYKFIQKAMKEGRYAAPSENKADEKKRK